MIFKKSGTITVTNGLSGREKKEDVVFHVEECKCGKRIGYSLNECNKKEELNPDLILQKIGDIDIWEEFQAKQKLEWLEELKK
jgi:hypothetical protein